MNITVRLDDPDVLDIYNKYISDGYTINRLFQESLITKDHLDKLELPKISSDETTTSGDDPVVISLITQLISEVRSQRDTIVDSCNKQTIDALASQIRDPIIKNTNKIEDVINNFCGKVSKSSCKGSIGENLVVMYLETNFPKSEVVVVSTDARSCDIKVKVSGCTILVEVKTYSRNVPTAEVDKFQRDLNTCSCDAGIFISLTSGIAHKKKLETSMCGDKPVVYLPNTDTTTTGLFYAITYVKQLLSQRHTTDTVKNASEYLDIVKDQLDQVDILNGEIKKLETTTSQKITKLKGIIQKIEAGANRQLSMLNE